MGIGRVSKSSKKKTFTTSGEFSAAFTGLGGLGKTPQRWLSIAILESAFRRKKYVSLFLFLC
jgi:hypothetical protein